MPWRGSVDASSSLIEKKRMRGSDAVVQAPLNAPVKRVKDAVCASLRTKPEEFLCRHQECPLQNLASVAPCVGRKLGVVEGGGIDAHPFLPGRCRDTRIRRGVRPLGIAAEGNETARFPGQGANGHIAERTADLLARGYIDRNAGEYPHEQLSAQLGRVVELRLKELDQHLATLRMADQDYFPPLVIVRQIIVEGGKNIGRRHLDI